MGGGRGVPHVHGRSGRDQQRGHREAGSRAIAAGREGSSGMKINDAVLGVVFGVLALAILVHVRSFPSLPGQPYGPSTFPAFIAAALLLCAVGLVVRGVRSEEHTSELQSLMRISYAVFGLKKKKQT